MITYAPKAVARGSLPPETELHRPAARAAAQMHADFCVLHGMDTEGMSRQDLEHMVTVCRSPDATPEQRADFFAAYQELFRRKDLQTKQLEGMSHRDLEHMVTVGRSSDATPEQRSDAFAADQELFRRRYPEIKGKSHQDLEHMIAVGRSPDATPEQQMSGLAAFDELFRRRELETKQLLEEKEALLQISAVLKETRRRMGLVTAKGCSFAARAQ